MRSEHTDIRAALHAADAHGTAPDAALHTALHALEPHRQHWHALLAGIAADAGSAAASNLIGGWQDDGTLDDDYDYDPASDPDSDLHAYIHGTVPGIADATVDHTRDRLYDLFKDALEAGTIIALVAALDGAYSGWTGQQVARQTSGAQGGSSASSDANTQEPSDLVGSRAGMLAVNAVAPAWNLGEQDTVGDVTSDDNPQAPTDDTGAPLVAAKTWVSVGDERVRPAHAEADGQTVALDAPFIVDGEELQTPGDPDGSDGNIINCRCSAAYVLVPADQLDDVTD